MNIEQAKAIPLSKILDVLGHKPVRTTDHEQFFFSPFRQEKNASFKIDTRTNIWIDFGTKEGGDVIHFVCKYLATRGEDSTVHDALRWVRNMVPSMTPYEAVIRGEIVQYQPALKLTYTTTIGNKGLVEWIKARGIPLDLAKKYLQQAKVENVKHGFNFNALTLKNENGGHELMNQYGFKGSVGGKYLSFIRGATPNGRIHIFEAAFDYFSGLCAAEKEQFEDDAIILNTVAHIKEAIGYIQTNPYKVIIPWLDNDEAGANALKILQEFAANKNCIVKPKNHLYAGHKDVNDWHRFKLGLK